MMQPVGMDKARELVRKYLAEARAQRPRGDDEILTHRIIVTADDREPFFNSADLSSQEYSDMFDRIFVAVQEVE